MGQNSGFEAYTKAENRRTKTAPMTKGMLMLDLFTQIT